MKRTNQVLGPSTALTVLGAFVAGAILVSAAEPAPQLQGHVTKTGIYVLTGSERRISEEGSATGYVTEGGKTFQSSVTNVPLGKGISFGFDFRIDGAPADHPVRLTHIITHPKMKKPDGTVLEKQSFDRDVTGSAGVIYGRLWYTLREDYELLSGEWTLMVCHGTSVLVEKKFTVTQPGTSAEREQAVPSPALEQTNGEFSGCPSPVLPEQALFLGQYANLELTITANRDGSLEKVLISKKSRARLYDEYTRDWVEKHWRMPAAKAGEPDLRKFIAPIVYPKAEWPAGHYPRPSYPAEYLRNHIEGIVIIEFRVAPSGEIKSTRTLLSSGHKGLDTYTEQWVRKEWKFPPGEERCYYWPVAYVLK
jgi:TonB family protein